MSPQVPQARSRATEIRPYRAQDEAAVVALLQDAFGRWPTDMDGVDPLAFFRWKHRSGPFGPSAAVVAVDGERVVGYLAWLPWMLRCGGRRIMSYRTTDFAVARSHRGGDVSMAMIRDGKRLLADGYALTWSNPNQLSHRRAGGSGQGRVGTVRTFVRPVPVGLACRLRAPGQRAATRGRDARTRAADACAGARAAGEVLAEVAGWLSGLLERDCSGRLHTARDLAFLRWRYGAFADYRAVCLDHEGVAIVRLRRRGSVRIAKVCELVVGDDDPGAAWALARRVSQTVGADLLTCGFASPVAAARCGFVPAPGGHALMVRPVRPDLVPDPTRAASWELSLGDLELI
ncbi:MAG TPA: GNAT family N-acetyltransferase [Solirubrobacteraceae bacterium]|nr:GNAT family N-acetyltransferase [Solirubrobacteraceae bacterium]